MKRITRFQIDKIDYTNTWKGEIVGSVKWSRGSEIVKSIYNGSVFDGFRKILSYDELRSMVSDCRENGNIIFDATDEIAFRIRRWSYHRK